MENIGLQDSLLSRFDLLFIMLDQMDPEQDREISDHVLRMHRYRDPREQEGAGTEHHRLQDRHSRSGPHILTLFCSVLASSHGAGRVGGRAGYG